MDGARIQTQPIYHIKFDEYLQPKKPHKSRKLLFAEKVAKSKSKPHKLQLKLLEHPVVHTERSSKIQTLLQYIKQKFTAWTTRQRRRQCKVKTISVNNEVVHSENFYTKIRKFKLPRFLEFLTSSKEDALCKRKSGFEIYCELASIHGFVNFLNAKTWQRAIWCLVIFLAVLMSVIFLVMSQLLSAKTPIIMYTESTHHPAWTIHFPAITICNLNRISRWRSEHLADKFANSTSLSKDEILKLFYLSLYYVDQLNATETEYLALHQLLKQNNYTFSDFIKEISPNCELELRRCKWKGRNERCTKLFQKIATPQGMCCAFNYFAKARQQYRYRPPSQITSCNYKTGLTVLLDPHVEDYTAALIKSTGYQVLIHDAVNYPENSVEHQYVQSGTETSINIVPQNTYATVYVRGEKLYNRRCYFNDEVRFLYFANGTQTNCLAECRGKTVVKTCGCVPWYLPQEIGTRTCDMSDAMCFTKHKGRFHGILDESTSTHNYKEDRYAENFICDCYPECSYNRYYSNIDSGQLDRTYSEEDKRFFLGIQVKHHILLHVFYGDLLAEKYRLDVYENWLTFVGTFGGITGLYMGYSLVSGFEMLFFVFIRPLCNWLTKQQIRYKNKKKQKRIAAEVVRKALD